MKALILVGGYGTRLRPLTFTTPKPLVPFANKPIVVHQIEALVKVGVKEIVLAVNVQPTLMMEFLAECEKTYNIKIHCSLEDQPMGTAGPLALARELLTKDNHPFFMFNSDVICTFPLQKMIDFHLAHKAEGTIMVTPVEDPSKYGVVISKENGEIERFIEKPTKFISDRINAGIYLFNTSILSRIEMRPTSIEREIFPVMASQHQLYSMDLPGYWMDIGQPKDFLKGMVLHLKYMAEEKQTTLNRDGVKIIGNVLLHETATIGAGSVIGPDVVIGPGVVIGEGVRISSSTVIERSRVKAHALIKGSLIDRECVIGSWANLQGCVL